MILAQNKGLSGLSHYLCHLFLATDHRYCCQWIEFMWWSWSFIVCMCFTRYKMAARNTKMWIVKNILYHFLIDNLAEVLYDPWGWMKTDTRDVKWKIFVSEVWGWSGTINSESAKCCCLLSAVCCRLKKQLIGSRRHTAQLRSVREWTRACPTPYSCLYISICHYLWSFFFRHDSYLFYGVRYLHLNSIAIAGFYPQSMIFSFAVKMFLLLYTNTKIKIVIAINV